MIAAKRIPGVVLAGGLSRRMGGGDKTLRMLAGTPMIDRVIERLQPQVSEVAINANGDPRRFEPRSLKILADVAGDHSGPLAGILTAMRWAQSDHPDATHVVTVASDTPLFPADIVDCFTAMAEERRHHRDGALARQPPPGLRALAGRAGRRSGSVAARTRRR